MSQDVMVPLIGAALVVTADKLNREMLEREVQDVHGEWWNKGGRIGTSLLTYKYDGWRFSVPSRQCYDLNVVVGELRTQVEGKLGQLALVCDGNGYDVELSCVVRMNQQAPGLTLEKDNVSWLCELHAALDIDVILTAG